MTGVEELVGAAILDAVVGSASVTGFGSAAVTLEVAGFTLSASATATAVGAVALGAAAIGLSYALSSRPQTPKPEDGSQALKQAVPPRIRGYGVNRLAGYYMLFEAAGSPSFSYDVVAFHSGQIGSIDGVYLSDNLVTFDADLNTGAAGAVNGGDTPGGEYLGYVNAQCRLGTTTQTALDRLTTDSNINTLWTTAFSGKGIAHACIVCYPRSTPTDYANTYPRGRPEASFVCHCSPIWDPRDGAQSRDDATTWTVSANPVLQLIDFLTRADGGMGLDYDSLIAPVLDAWKAQADICDQVVSGKPRYASHGWFAFDNKPADIIGKILSTCDGWLSSNGDGTLSLVVGQYVAPTSPAITVEDCVYGFTVDCGAPDEELVNQLDVTYTDPDSKYVTNQLAPVRDEASISATGVVRAKPLDLSWVQVPAQAIRLASRALLRANPTRKGTLITTLYGLRWLGLRWVPMQFPLIKGLENCVIEIQDAEIDLLGDTVTFTWQLVDPTSLAAL